MMEFTFSFVGSTIKRIRFCHKGGRSIQSTLSLNLAITLLSYITVGVKFILRIIISHTYPKLQVAHPINDTKRFTSGNISINPTGIEFHEKALSHGTKPIKRPQVQKGI